MNNAHEKVLFPFIGVADREKAASVFMLFAQGG